MRKIIKPLPGEFPSFANMYMKLLPDDGFVLQHMEENFLLVKQLIEGMPEKMLYHRYKPGKWSIKETLVHIIDAERIFSCRALRFARNEKRNLIGFDQDSYTRYSHADQRKLDNIFEEYEAVRHATISLFEGLPEDSFMRMVTANDATVRALAYHIAGHEVHHINLIKDLYIPSSQH